MSERVTRPVNEPLLAEVRRARTQDVPGIRALVDWLVGRLTGCLTGWGVAASGR